MEYLYEKCVDEYTRCLKKAEVCVHPAGNLYGLTFDPTSSVAYERLLDIKRRLRHKKLIFLVKDCDTAFSYWQPLSKAWQQTIHEVWPAHLSIIASLREAEEVPYGSAFLPYKLGWKNLGFRIPSYEKRHWFWDVLCKFPYPLPTTSINLAGESPYVDIAEVKRFADRYGVYCPEEVFMYDKACREYKPSTVVTYVDEQSYKVLREGYYSEAVIRNVMKNLRQV